MVLLVLSMSLYGTSSTQPHTYVTLGVVESCILVRKVYYESNDSSHPRVYLTHSFFDHAHAHTYADVD